MYIIWPILNHLDEILLDIGFSLTGLPPFPDPKPPILKNRAYFSLEPRQRKREYRNKNHHTRNRYWTKDDPSIFVRQREWNPKTMHYVIFAC